MFYGVFWNKRTCNQPDVRKIIYYNFFSHVKLISLPSKFGQLVALAWLLTLAKPRFPHRWARTTVGKRTPVVCSQTVFSAPLHSTHWSCIHTLHVVTRVCRELPEGRPPCPVCLVQRVDQVIIHQQDNLKLAYVINTNNTRICQSEGDIYFTFEGILENKVYESFRPHTHSKYFMTKYLPKFLNNCGNSKWKMSKFPIFLLQKFKNYFQSTHLKS